MSSQRIIGVVVLVVGIVLLIVGLNASHSVADRASDFWTGRFTQTTTWYIIGGIAAGVLGLLMVAFGGRGSGSAK
jgi:uncharacterized membrane protein